MAYKGTPLYTEDDDLFETLQLSKEAGVLVLVHAENGDAIAKLQEQALARGDTDPKFHALTRPEAVEAEATNRAIRLAEVAEAPILVVHVSCAGAARGRPPRPRARPDRLRRDLPAVLRLRVRGPGPKEGFEGAKYVCSPPLRDPVEPSGAVERSQDRRPANIRLRPLRVQLRGSEGDGQGRLHAHPQRIARSRGAGDDALDARRDARASSPRTSSSPSSPPTRRASTAPTRRRARSLPARTRTSCSGTRTYETTATVENRHGNVDYTPYEGMELPRRTGLACTCGANLVYKDGEVVGERGSGRFVERSFTATKGMEVRV